MKKLLNEFFSKQGQNTSTPTWTINLCVGRLREDVEEAESVVKKESIVKKKSVVKKKSIVKKKTAQKKQSQSKKKLKTDSAVKIYIIFILCQHLS